MINWLERKLLKNMSWIVFWIIIIILFIYILQFIQLPTWKIITQLFWIEEINKTISIESTITYLGAILAFWYWYKKYERDKELDLIEKYQLWTITISNIDELQKWEMVYLLKRNWYIEKWIWELIERNNTKIFYEFLKEYLTLKSEKEIIEKTNILSKKIVEIIIYRWNNNFRKYIIKILDGIKKWEDLPDELNLWENWQLTDEEKLFYKNLEIIIKIIKDIDWKLNN